ncbi:MAG TPA: methyltransferase domain-containing protein [Candidatus Hydrogenedentes bacterium]|nr:methyltransferase domain-containing protein [Candidatus Hydrogenedentota bacterium]
MSHPASIPRLEIIGLAQGGEGIARLDGQAWFVPFAYPGDTVSAQPAARHRSWGRALPTLVHRPSPHRQPFIGGADAPKQAYLWGCFDYAGQSAWKPRLAAETLRRLGGILIEPDFIPAPESLRLGWRDRCTFHPDPQGRPAYYLWHTHRAEPVRRCPLAGPHVNRALENLAETGISGPVTVTAHPETGETLIWCADKDRQRLADRLPYPVNSPRNGQPAARFMMDGVPVVNGAFCQSSLLLNRILRDAVSRAVGDAQTILDCYCGNGNLTLDLARRAAVTGFDICPSAVEAARSVSAGDYRVGSEPDMARALDSTDFDAVVLDPPRTGARQLASALAGCRARRIVWASCDAATLARDLRTVLAGGWNLVACTVIDLFPYTPHAEMLCVLERPS